MKLFGKKGKPPVADDPRFDPRSSYAVAPIPRPAGPPASSTPLGDQLAKGGPGVTDRYVVLPRALVEEMPLPWQRQMAGLLEQFHHMNRGLSWPRYRVLPSREERLVDLDEEQLAEAGYLVELDISGDMVYRERNGREVENPEAKRVLVTCLDPVVAAAERARRAAQPPAGAAPRPGAGGRPVPMNIGPQPVWQPVPSAGQAPADDRTPPRGIPAQERSPADPVDWFADERGSQPDRTFGPTGEPIERPYRYGDDT